MFDIYDDPDEIEKRCKEGPVLCWRLNPNIRFPILRWLVHNRYVFDLGDGEQRKLAVALGFYKEPVPEKLEPKNIKRWNGTDQATSADYDIMVELVDGDEPYIILNEQITTQQIDTLRSVGRILVTKHNGKNQYCMDCAYYYENKKVAKKPYIYKKGD